MHSDSRQMSPVMSLDDARRVLRIRKQTIYDLIESGVLRTFQRGRFRYVTDEALRAAIRHMESTGSAPAKNGA